MCRFVSISYGRSGEDELGWFLPTVAGDADSVPKGGSILPFVNQARCFAFQKQGSLRLCCGKVFIPFVGILQFDNACRLLFCSCRLSAPFRAFYIDRTEGIEVILQLVVNHSLQVVHNNSLISDRNIGIISHSYKSFSKNWR